MLSVVSAAMVSSGSFDGMIRTPTTVGPAVVDGSLGGRDVDVDDIECTAEQRDVAPLDGHPVGGEPTRHDRVALGRVPEVLHRQLQRERLTRVDVDVVVGEPGLYGHASTLLANGAASGWQSVQFSMLCSWSARIGLAWCRGPTRRLVS